MSLYTNYIEGVFIFISFPLSLSNPTVYKEVRVLKKVIENREEKRSSVGRFAIFSFLRSL